MVNIKLLEQNPNLFWECSDIEDWLTEHGYTAVRFECEKDSITRIYCQKRVVEYEEGGWWHFNSVSQTLSVEDVRNMQKEAEALDD